MAEKVVGGLKWVKGEIATTLRRVRDLVETYGASGDPAVLKDAVESLFEIRGVLLALQLHLPARLAEEMQRLADAMVSGTVRNPKEAAEAMMLALIQLPDHLDRLDAGVALPPLNLWPTINDLRASRGTAPLSQAELLVPASVLAEDSADYPPSEALDALATDIRKVRPHFHRHLLEWYRPATSAEGLVKLGGLFHQLHRYLLEGILADLFRLAGAYVDALQGGQVSPGTAPQALIGHLDRVFKPLIQIPPAWPEAEAFGLVDDFLTALANAEVQSPVVTELQATYGQTSAPGASGEALAGLAQAMLVELSAIKEQLDLFVRGGRGDRAPLGEMQSTLVRLGRTLDVATTGRLPDRLRELAGKFGELVGSDPQKDPPRVEALAAELLAIEAELQAYAEHRRPGGAGGTSAGLFSAELVAATLREAQAELAHIKEAVQACQVPEARPTAFTQVPDRLANISGALQILGHDSAANLAEDIAALVQRHYLQPGRWPQAPELASLADAIAALELYIERLEEGEPPDAGLLSGAGDTLIALNNRLGETAPAEIGIGASTPPPATGTYAGADLPRAPASDAAPDPAGITPEFLDIFLEEAQDETESVRVQLAQWRADPADEEALATLRRSFHTLKGSGRLVGAERVGDLAQSIEAVLNRVIERSLIPGPELMTLVADAAGRLPDLVAAEAEGRPLSVGDLVQRAGQLTGSIATRSPAVVSAGAGAPHQAEIIPWPGREPPSAPAAPVAEPAAPEPAQASEADAINLDHASLFREDDELLDIFRVETREHLEDVRAFLERAAGGDPMPDETTVRALHTLTGSARMSGVDSIAVVTKALELRLRQFLTQSNAVPEDLIGLIAQAADGIEARIAEIPAVGPGAVALASLAGALATTPAEAGIAPPAADEPAPLVDMSADLGLPEPEPELEATAQDLEDYVAITELEDQFLDQATDEAPVLDEKPGVSTPEDAQSEVDLEAEAQPGREDSRLVAELEQASGDLTPEPAAESADEPEVGIALEESAPLADLEPAGAEEPQQIVLEGEPEVGPLDEPVEVLPEPELEPAAGPAPEGEPELPQAPEPEPGPHPPLEGVAGDEAAPTQAESAVASAAEADQPVHPTEIPAPEQAAATAAPALDDDLQSPPGDPELTTLFMEDARDLLDGIDARIREWQLAPQELGFLDGINRLLHTLKGSARLTGLTAIGDLSHALETRLIAVAKSSGVVDDTTLELTQKAADTLSLQIDALEQGAPLPRARALVEALSGAPEPAPAAGAEEPATVIMRPAEPARPGTAPSPAPAAGEREGTTAAAGVPQIRVRSDLLDRLVDNSGEISLYRARLAQRNGLMGFGLGELDQTVARLREQLRLLEIETEAQILHRVEREGLSSQDGAIFDPLELDRFSNLQQLSRALSETVNDLVSLKDLLGGYQRESSDLLTQQARIADDLQDGLLRTRMVPFVQVVPRLHRLVRQTADSLGKSARLEVIGPEVELDRTILDRLVAPLEHLLRNAVGHGLESPEDRAKAGKPKLGLVTLALSREGNDVVMDLRDDGRGLNLTAIRSQAIARGLLAPKTPLDDAALMQFVFEPGFTTAGRVTQISGRGVGLDVVASEIKAANGSIALESKAGQGTRFTVRLPLTLAIIEAFLVSVGDNIYAVPHATVEGAARIGRDDLEAVYRGGPQDFDYHGHSYRIAYLGGILDAHQKPELGERRWLPLLLARVGDLRVALQVDNLIESGRIVVKPLGPQLAGVRWLSGGTILPDGRVALILDALALLRSGAIQDYRPAGLPSATALAPVCVMVVDDSLTVRRVTSRLLRRQNMEVLTAKDGVEALTLLDERRPDVLLLDIEMPRMDGYELTRHVRRSPRLRDLPIIMITSRTGEKHREHARSLGVNRYLGKPYQESELLGEISSVLKEQQP